MIRSWPPKPRPSRAALARAGHRLHVPRPEEVPDLGGMGGILDDLLPGPQFEAIVVGVDARNKTPAELRAAALAGIDDGPPRPRRAAFAGMGGMGAIKLPKIDLTKAADRLLGGKVSQVSGQVEQAGLALKIAAAASVFSAVATLIALRRK